MPTPAATCHLAFTVTGNRTQTTRKPGGDHEVALCAALELASAEDAGSAPEWVHLLPAGEIRTVDGRGPYTVEDMTALMAASLKRGKLVLDVNHSTDLKAPKGEEAPARGWIIDLQAREDGLWGKVEWTPAGRAAVIAKEYRGISPAIVHGKADKIIRAVARASLVNQPNLEGLVALHQESSEMEFRDQVIGALSLDADADDAAILAAITANASATETAVHAALAPIYAQLELEPGMDLKGAIVSLQAAKPAGADTITALQAELKDVGEQLVALQQAGAQDKATAFVDAAIAEGRVGVKPMRDEYISMHMADPAKTERLIGALPAIGGKIAQPGGQPKRSAEPDAADERVMALMGIDPDEFKKARAAELGVEVETL